MTDESVLSQLSFSDLWNPAIIGITAILAVLYLLAVGPMRVHFRENAPINAGRKVLFLMGLFTFYLAVGSPLRAMGQHYLFSAHMMQQSLLFFIMPPLLLLGTPAWLIRPLLQKRPVQKVLPVLRHPAVSVLLFNVVLSVFYFPLIFDTLMEYSVWSIWFHVFLTLTSIQMWWIIICPVPELDRLPEIKKILYIVANGLLLGPLFGMILYAKEPLYEHYANVPQFFNFLSPWIDQQIGVVTLMAIQETALIFALAWIIFRWSRKDMKTASTD